MNNYQPLDRIPADFSEWGARLTKAEPTATGVFRLVNIRPTAPKSFEEQRIIVLVLDENGQAMPNVPVVFGYSTGPVVAPYLNWNTPYPPAKALVVNTQGSGQIEQIQGSAVKPGEPGGVTVYIGESDISSDAVSGCGMLASHEGLHLTFQLYRTGVKPINERLDSFEARLEALEKIVFG